MKLRFHHGRGAIVAAVLFLVLSLSFVASAVADPTIELSFDKELRAEPFTGRVVLFLWPAENGKPPRRWEMIGTNPIASIDVKDWKPETPLKIKNPRAYPTDFDEIHGKFRVRAVMQNNPALPNGLDTPGNLISKWTAVDLSPESKRRIRIKLNRKNEDPDRQDRAELKFVEFKSRLLSEFHGREVMMRAAVRLPDGFESQPDRRFAAIYYIPGFGGDEREAMQIARMLGDPDSSFVRIGLDPTLRLGHTVFADSDNNGPCARALVEEFIPHLESKFRLLPEARGRYLTGHSSGGWSSLWLQVTYPDFFNGCWSGSPDPVDFHDFTGVNLYEDECFYYLNGSDKDPRPIMRQSGKVLYSIEQFARMEDVIGPGGQLMAFEAVFGPKGKNGLPVPMYDRRTGRIDRKVVDAWKRYDIVEKLTREWDTLGPKLKGKITVIMGDEDNFYLNGATRRLKEKLESLGSDARITIVPQLDHMTIVFSPPYRAVITEITERFKASEPD